MCLYPLKVWQLPDRPQVLFSEPKLCLPGTKVFYVPCGNCAECVSNYSRVWQVRNLMELSLHRDAVFVSLTYGDVNVNFDVVDLRPKDFQDFIKRVRKHFEPRKIRFFGCGEYGKKNNRPHYHVILYGCDFEDKWLFYVDDSGVPVYRSPTLEKLWKFGFSSCAPVGLKTCKYVAKYMQKLDERSHTVPPFTRMSLKPGIGVGALKDYNINSDCLYVQGIRIKLPRYFLDYLESGGVDMRRIRQLRVNRAVLNPPNLGKLKSKRLQFKQKLGKDIAKSAKIKLKRLHKGFVDI